MYIGKINETKRYIIDPGSATVIGAALSTFGNFVGIGAGSYSQSKQNVFNAQEAQKTRDWQEKMWNLNNEYNTPLAQTQRLQEAGLNPNLVYGNGSMQNSASLASGGATATSASGAFASSQADKIERAFDIASKKLFLEQQQANIDNTKEDTNNKKVQTEFTSSQNKGVQLDNLLKSETFKDNVDIVANTNNKLLMDTAEAHARMSVAYKQLDLIAQNVELLKAEQNLTEQKEKQVKQDMLTALGTYFKSLQVMNSQINANNASAKSALANARYQIAMANTVEQLRPHIVADAKNQADISKVDAFIANVTKDKRQMTVEGMLDVQDATISVMKAQAFKLAEEGDYVAMQAIANSCGSLMAGFR